MRAAADVATRRNDHGLDPVAEGQRAAVILWTDDTPAGYARCRSSVQSPCGPRSPGSTGC